MLGLRRALATWMAAIASMLFLRVAKGGMHVELQMGSVAESQGKVASKLQEDST